MCNTNELVNQPRQRNHMPGRPEFFMKKCAAGKIICEKNVTQEKLTSQNEPQASFFRLNPDGYSFLLM